MPNILDYFWLFNSLLPTFDKRVKNMTPNKIEIDLSKLENEILGFDEVIENAYKVIEAAKQERSLKVQLRDYIISDYLPNYSTDNEPDLALKEDEQVHFFEVKTGKVGQPTGISDFLRSYIINNKSAHTKAISEAYAKEINARLDSNFKKTVSRALTRLKLSGEIDNELKDGGKRAGSIWYCKYTNQK